LIELLIPHFVFDFWLNAPTVGDFWRVYIYGGLSLFALTSRWHDPPLGDSPLQAARIVGNCPQEAYEPPGAFQKLPGWTRDSVVLRFIRGTVLLGSIITIAGFGGAIGPALVGIGMLWLHGALAGALGTNHRWTVPVAVLLSGAIADMRGPLSIDAWLASRIIDYPFEIGGAAIVPSGIVGRVALVMSVLTLLSGGISKLRLGGVRWADGESLRHYIQRPSVGASMELKQWIVNRPAVCRLLAGATLALELSSPLAFISTELRLVILGAATLMHLGIWLTMRPNYLPQVWCYALCFFPSNHGTAPHGIAATSVAALISAGALCFTFAALRGIEWWPFTSVPMYAFYRGPASQWSHETLMNEGQAHSLSAEYIRSGLPYPLGWSPQWIAVQLHTAEGQRILAPGGVTGKHWRRLLHRAAALHWANRHSAFEFLVRHQTSLKSLLSENELRNGSVELVASIGGKKSVLATRSLATQPSILSLKRN